MARAAALKVALAAVALLSPGAALAGPVDRWAAEIAEASARFGIPEQWIRRAMRAESNGRTVLDGRPIVSRAGAMGLMQLMPGTWREMRARFGLGPDPHDPKDNIMAGTAYLRLMYERFGFPGLFAAYNAGPGRYAAHLSGGRGLPAETRAYVLAVAGHAYALDGRSVRRRKPPPPIFAVRTDTAPAIAGRSSLPPADAGLFVALGSSAST